MAKERLFKGKSIEELEKMTLEDAMKLMKSRQRRALRNGIKDKEKILLKKIKDSKSGKRKKPVKTHLRDTVIIPEMIGATVHVHQGKSFEPVVINELMIGHRLGEFTLTRKRVSHSAAGIGATKSSKSASVK
ncbi:MAG: 30S ribosomal protein S19 [Candidatus Nanoarchaeia archaeon]|nr:30S ribosomal protein S19 [Candidatus Nanoarchaeia archaeon]